MTTFDPSPPARAYRVLRALCLVTAVANAGGNVGLLLVREPLFAWLRVPPPADLYAFTAVSAFSFTMGILAFLVWLAPERSVPLLVVGAIGKGLYALVNFAFHFGGGLHPFYLAFGAWDAAFTVVFLLFVVHLVSRDLVALNTGALRPGLVRPRTRRALVLFYSLTGNGQRAIQAVERGLRAGGYAVDLVRVEAEEPLFSFPFRSLAVFVRIAVRAILRRPARARPLPARSADHDLVVVECPTWFVGMAAPMEGVFQDERWRGLFEGRDAAVVTVCRGLSRRTQAMTVRWIERRGGRVVGARACPNPGREPLRVWSLFFFLGFGEPKRPRWLAPLLTSPFVSDEVLADLERFGRALAARPMEAEAGGAQARARGAA
jgi:hypothetical protein